MNIGATLLIYLIKLFSLIQRLIVAFFVLIIYRPGRAVIRVLFYRIFVKFYAWYLKILKQVGWSSRREKLFTFVFNHKLVHILVVGLTCLLIFINQTAKTQAEDMADMADKTILSTLIKSETSAYEGETEELIIETFDQEAVITPAQQSYLDGLSALKPQPRASLTDEEADSDDIATIQEGSALIKPEIASTQIAKRPRTGNVTYTVQPGDTVSTIADTFEISVNTILWENNLSAYSIIRPGDELVILPMTGVTHKVAKGENLANIAMKYNVTEQVVLESNKLASAANLQAGQLLLVPGGRKITYTAYSSPSVSGLSAIRNLAKSANAKPRAGNKMNWPAAGRRITQYFSWRHHAIDIANKVGTPIYAADSGTVEYNGWGKGYGNQIVIDHGGGKKTRYAHLSKSFVKAGQEITKGQNIAAMGSTGWSTGPHLHFEVIINGGKYNPLNYIK